MRTGAPTVYRAVASPSSSSASRIAASALSHAPRTSPSSCWSRRAAPFPASSSRPRAGRGHHHLPRRLDLVRRELQSGRRGRRVGRGQRVARGPGRRLVGPPAQVSGRPQQRRDPRRRGQLLARGQPDRRHPRARSACSACSLGSACTVGRGPGLAARGSPPSAAGAGVHALRGPAHHRAVRHRAGRAGRRPGRADLCSRRCPAGRIRCPGPPRRPRPPPCPLSPVPLPRFPPLPCPPRAGLRGAASPRRPEAESPPPGVTTTGLAGGSRPGAGIPS